MATTSTSSTLNGRRVRRRSRGPAPSANRPIMDPVPSGSDVIGGDVGTVVQGYDNWGDAPGVPACRVRSTAEAL